MGFDNTKVYKIELMVVDPNGEFDSRPEELKACLEKCKYVYPTIVSLESREIGPWDDKHPLNQGSTWKETFLNLFKKD